MTGTRKMERFERDTFSAASPSASPDGHETPSLSALRTRLTQRFVSLADSVTAGFEEFAIGPGAWRVELTAPTGMSTGAGKQALQHLRLLPTRPGYATIVGGAVNSIEKTAELRSYEHAAYVHAVRFRHRFEISPPEWEQFLRRAEVVLKAAGMVTARTPPPRELVEQHRKLRRVSGGAIAAFTVVLVLALVVAWRVVLTVASGGAG